MSEQLPTALDENVRDKKNRLERLGVAALSIFGTGVFGLLVYLIGYKLMLSQGKLLAGLGILAFIIIGASGLLSVILFAKANEVEEESGKHRLQQSEELISSHGTEKLMPASQPAPIGSVTERTTELLGAGTGSGAKESES